MAGALVTRPGRAAARPRRRAIPWPAAPLAAALSVGAAYVHLAYVDSHWEDWWAYGAFFLGVGVLQALFAVAILRWPSTLLVLGGIAGNLAIVGMYILSRTEGVPMGPHAGVKEAAGAVDLVTTGGEVVLVAVLLTLLSARPRRWIVNGMLLAGVALWVMRLSEGLG
jgi:hypothetical protein